MVYSRFTTTTTNDTISNAFDYTGAVIFVAAEFFLQMKEKYTPTHQQTIHHHTIEQGAPRSLFSPCSHHPFHHNYIAESKFATSFGAAMYVHLLVILRFLVKNRIAPSPVISESPNFDFVVYIPPNEKGSRGTGTPMFTPIIPARKRGVKYSA